VNNGASVLRDAKFDPQCFYGGEGVLYFTTAHQGCPLQLEKLEMLEKLENEPFFSWKSWNFLGLIMINGIIECKS